MARSNRRRNRRPTNNTPPLLAAAPARSGLTARQVALLLAPISPQRVLTNENGDRYLQGWDVERWLTRIFGLCGWGTTVPAVELARELEIPAEPGEEAPIRYQVVYRATVELTVRSETGSVLTVVSGVGAHASAAVTLRGLAEAHVDTAKAAETDALKRAAKHLGDAFGLSLRNPVDPFGPVVVGTLVNGRGDLPGPDGPAETVTPPQPGRHRQVAPEVQDLLAAAGEAGTDLPALQKVVRRAKRAGLLGEHAGRLAGEPATLGAVLDQLAVRAVHTQPLNTDTPAPAGPPLAELPAGQGTYPCGCTRRAVIAGGNQHPDTCPDRTPALNGARP